ncbi:hypothetical protein CRG98_024901 [Punica granatum]|uniref:Uncharacterized protein n=1 Tax=Punica granatum TaxID=22663 RepID=A0A2I0JEM7_PUNGR|nr:hypothetical protein CRG98_024901 [Punica granatum]
MWVSVDRIKSRSEGRGTNLGLRGLLFQVRERNDGGRRRRRRRTVDPTLSPRVDSWPPWETNYEAYETPGIFSVVLKSLKRQQQWVRIRWLLAQIAIVSSQCQREAFDFELFSRMQFKG